MKTHIIDQAGDAVAQAYRAYHLSIGGVLGEAMRGVAPTSAKSRAASIANLQQFQTTTLTSIAGTLDTALASIVNMASRGANTELTDEQVIEIENGVWEHRNEALTTIAGTLHRDALVAAKRIKDFSLRVELLLNSTRQDYRSAVASATAVEANRPIAFTQLDASGKRWQPSVYAATAVKSVLQASYADTFVRAASLGGHSQVKVVYPDPSHDDHGVLLSISDDYVALRDALFHPNSSASLALEG